MSQHPQQPVDRIPSDSLEEEEHDADEQSSEQMEDQLLPQPVFDMADQHPDLSPQELQALDYLKSVRQQKQRLTTQPRYVVQHAEEQSQPQKIQQSQQPQNVELMQWKAQTLRHWETVVGNLTYLRDHQQHHNHHNQRVEPDLTVAPLAAKLACNEWLTLPRVEQLLARLSERRCRELNGQEEGSPYYHEWIYSLLAVHRMLAPYSNFEGLGSLNAALQLERQRSRSGLKWAVLLVVLEQGFSQHSLQPLYSQITSRSD